MHGIDKDHGIDMDSWYRHGLMVLTWTLSIEMDSWFRHELMVQTWTHGIDKDSWYKTHGIDNTHGSDLDSWYRMVFLNHTRTRGPSVTRMRGGTKWTPFNGGVYTIVGANYASLKHDKPVQGLHPSDCPALKYI